MNTLTSIDALPGTGGDLATWVSTIHDAASDMAAARAIDSVKNVPGLSPDEVREIIQTTPILGIGLPGPVNLDVATAIMHSLREGTLPNGIAERAAEHREAIDRLRPEDLQPHVGWLALGLVRRAVQAKDHAALKTARELWVSADIGKPWIGKRIHASFSSQGRCTRNLLRDVIYGEASGQT